jgi:hypothetical protein
MDDEPADGLTFPEADERSWRAYLADFKENVFPVFEQYGFTLPEAFLAWQMNRVNNNVSSLAEPDA